MTPLLTFYTISEAAEILRLSPDTVRCYARDHKIPCRRFGRKTVFSESDLLAYSDASRVEREEAPRREGRLVAGKVKTIDQYLSLRRRA
jgi:excisionase family DNA binding protein